MAIRFGGTLILAVPMKDGIVVSAESRRTTERLQYRDGVRKVHSLSGRSDLVFFATGTTLVTDPDPNNPSTNEWDHSGVIRHDVISHLREFLTTSPPDIFSEDYNNRLADHFRRHTSEALRANAFLPFRGPELLFQVTLVQYQPALGTSNIGQFMISYDTSGNIVADHVKYKTSSRTQHFQYYRSGDTGLMQHPSFRSLAPPGYLERGRRLQQTLIGAISEEDARLFGREFIEASVRVAALPDVGLAHKMGGPIYSYTVDGVRSLDEISVSGRASLPQQQTQLLADDLHRNG